MEPLWVYICFLSPIISIQNDYFCQTNESIFKNLNFEEYTNKFTLKLWSRKAVEVQQRTWFYFVNPLLRMVVI